MNHMIFCLLNCFDKKNYSEWIKVLGLRLQDCTGWTVLFQYTQEEEEGEGEKKTKHGDSRPILQV